MINVFVTASITYIVKTAKLVYILFMDETKNIEFGLDH